MECKKVLSSNKRCRAFAQKDKDFCFRHNPENEVISKLSSQKGGQNRAFSDRDTRRCQKILRQGNKRCLGGRCACPSWIKYGFSF